MTSYWQGHHELSGKSDENNLLKPNQSAPSIYIMIELCYFSLDQWEIRIHLFSGKCFNIPHDCDPHLLKPNLMNYCTWQFMVSWADRTSAQWAEYSISYHYWPNYLRRPADLVKLNPYPKRRKRRKFLKSETMSSQRGEGGRLKSKKMFWERGRKRRKLF